MIDAFLLQKGASKCYHRGMVTRLAKAAFICLGLIPAAFLGFCFIFEPRETWGVFVDVWGRIRWPW
jgi:hypothetical protein